MSTSGKKKWQYYEELSLQLLRDAKEILGLGRVEPKQTVPGESGADWEIDVVAYDLDSEKMVLVECKRRSNTKLDQETIGGFAYRLRDIGAERGVVVTTVGLQEGAKKVASHERIATVRVDADADPDNYVAMIASQIFAKVTDDSLESEPRIETIKKEPIEVRIDVGSEISTEVTVTEEEKDGEGG